MSDRRAVVNVPIDEWDEIRNREQKLHAEIAELTQKLAQAERTDPTGRLEPTIEAVEAAIPIIQFAVGNLHPDTVRGWPDDALHTFADRLTAMPGATQIQKELAIELRAFAHQAEMRARERATRPPEPAPLPEPPPAGNDADSADSADVS